MSKVRIHAKCDKCGPFAVVRRRKAVKRDGHHATDLPQNVVCPSCRMWGEIVKVEELPR
jgi:hypothetical protein